MIAKLYHVHHLSNHDYACDTRPRMTTLRIFYILICLCIYIQSSINFTQFNKRLLSDYQYPWLLSALHALSTFIGVRVFNYQNSSENGAGYEGNVLYLVGYTALYTINIAVSNVSLNLSTIAYHQTMRTSSVFFTVILSISLDQRYSSLTALSLLPVLAGVADLHSTSTDPGPSLFIVFGAFLASAKSVATNILQTRAYHRLSATQLLAAVCPMAFMQALIWARMNGEVDEFVVREIQARNLSLHGCGMFAFSAFSACWLNWISLTTNRIAGPLSMSVAGVIKQGILIWSAPNDGAITTFALLMTLGGGVLYLVGEAVHNTARHSRFEQRRRVQERGTDFPA